MNQLNAYKNIQIKTASPGRLIVLLYDETLKQIDLSLQYFKDGNKKYDLIHAAIVKAQDCITELMVSLDFEKGGEIAKNLFSLYMFFNQQLTEANLRKDSKPLEKLYKMIQDLRDAWNTAAAKIKVEEQHDSPGVNIAG